MTTTARGTFDVSMVPEPPYEVVDGVSLGRAAFNKRFHGDLEATSTVQMLGARTPFEGSAAYVALERITGSLAGRSGTFVLLHVGTMKRGKHELTVTVVADSGTGNLKGIEGQMSVDIREGKHFYALEYTLDGPP